MKDIKIRDINIKSESELDLVTNRCMETILETIPEFDNNPEKAQKKFSNFSFIEMRKMIKNSLADSNHKLLVAVNSKQEIVGHAIFSLKKDESNILYGFCFYFNKDGLPRWLAGVYIFLGFMLVYYVYLMIWGPDGRTPEGLPIQVAWQKIIVFAIGISVIVQALGMINHIKKI